MNWLKNTLIFAFLGTVASGACSSDNGTETPGSGATGADSGAGAAGLGAGGAAANAGGANGSGAANSSGGVGAANSAGGTQAAGGVGGVAGSGSPPDAGCGRYNEMCEQGSDCCSGECNADGACTSTIDGCKEAGDTCDTALDCCTLRCQKSKCSADACVSDNDACTGDAQCCSGQCVGDACQPLNTGCSTAGNDCTGNQNCCSKLCGDDGKCTLGASYCIQPGDVCTINEDCCTGACAIADGASLGTCVQPPSGSTFCTGVDGVVCNDCGGCCSRLCAPYGPTGVDICQPISGCHSTGDLCRENTDCCGGNDTDETLPGWGNGECQIEPGHTIGICRNPVNGEANPDGACSPQGNVCHYKDYACNGSSARANCCGGLGAKGGVCQLDPAGIPRCNGLGDTCRAEGETCASNADCCENRPCVPDDQGQLRCGADACVMKGGTCTIDGDCCTGLTCIRPPGETAGICDNPNPGTGGASGAGGAGSGGSCGLYLQICNGNGDCCNQVPCTDGICIFPPG